MATVTWDTIVEEFQYTGIRRSWADQVEDDEPSFGQFSFADAVKKNLKPVQEPVAQKAVQDQPEQIVTRNIKPPDVHGPVQVDELSFGQISFADAVTKHLTTVREEPHVHNLSEEEPQTRTQPGDHIGIRTIQSILMSATQMSLSHFHTAGMSSGRNSRTSQVPSAADAMNSIYNIHNTSMTFRSTVHDLFTMRRHVVGASLDSFVRTVGSSFTELPDHENVWYEVLKKEMYRGYILRMYIDYNKMRNHGFTLKDLAYESFGNECSWNVSPDFMGMIDIEVPADQPYLSPWLSKMKNCVCGTYDISGIISAAKELSFSTFVTAGTDILAIVRAPGVDKTQILLNNVSSIEQHYGIEAAAKVLSELTGSKIVSDFMTRRGKVLPFSKFSSEVHSKGLLSSMGLERPKDDIKHAIIAWGTGHIPRNKSIHESIITGITPRF